MAKCSSVQLECAAAIFTSKHRETRLYRRLVYGHETATRRSRDGKESTRSLIWTDTWLKRNGTWQIVAAQDMWADCK